VSDGRERCAQTPDIKTIASKPVSRGFRRNQPAMVHHILHFPKLDYSKIQFKVNIWRKALKINSEEENVSGTGTCRVVQRGARKPSGYWLELWFHVCF
jgi:hypothetical protein